MCASVLHVDAPPQACSPEPRGGNLSFREISYSSSARAIDFLRQTERIQSVRSGRIARTMNTLPVAQRTAFVGTPVPGRSLSAPRSRAAFAVRAQASRPLWIPSKHLSPLPSTRLLSRNPLADPFTTGFRLARYREYLMRSQ